MLGTNVLVLNKSYYPVHVTTVRDAFSMLYTGAVKAVDENYATFDYASWRELAVATHDSVGLVDRAIRVPRVILLVNYDRVPRRIVRFSRINIFLRDGGKCQYCLKKFRRKELSLDHVVPRALGGKTTWTNVVTSCLECNQKKSYKTLAQSGMKLPKRPVRPDKTPALSFRLGRGMYDEWKPFTKIIDATYWHLEMENDNELLNGELAESG